MAEADGRARPLAGGTDLIAQMKEGRRIPRVVVDVKKIPELNVLDLDEGEGLRIGAAVPLVDIIAFPPVRERFGDIAYACSLIGSVQIQSRATIGGNLCNAAPSADMAPPLICHDATAIIAGRGGVSSVAAEGFFVGPGRTILAPGELLVELRLPIPSSRSAAAYMRLIPREEMDIAVAGVGSLVVMEPDLRTCRGGRIALCAVAPTPIRAVEAERYLAGRVLGEAAMAEAGRLAAEASRPIDDVRGSAAYRRELVKVLTRRTLAQSLADLQRR